VGGTGANDTALQRYDPSADRWSVLAALSTRRDHVAAVVLGGKIYALGGRLGAGSAFNSVEIYDPEANTWSPGVPMQDTRAGFGAVVIDGEIYVCGGEVLVMPY